MNKAPKSIPEVKRQFVTAFSHGADFLARQSRCLSQPAYHAREILKLRELYTSESLDKILLYCMESDIYEIDGIKEVLKTKYIDIVFGSDSSSPEVQGKTFARDLSYYERGGGQN